MTDLQKQCLLVFAGCMDASGIDGLWGPQSAKATEMLQRKLGIEADGIWGAETDKTVREHIRSGNDFAVTNAPNNGTDTSNNGTDTSNNGTSTSNNGTSTPNNGTSTPNNGTSTPNNGTEETGTFWDDSEFFDREEFRCQCKGKYCNGFPEEPEEELVRVCNEIRRRLGVPVQIVDAGGSGVRCPRHNAAVGGVANSNHLYGKAADLHSEKSPQEMYRVAEEVLGNTGELGLYSWGIHVAVNCAYSRFNG